MIFLFISLYVLIAGCVGYGYLIYKYKKHYKDEYSFREMFEFRRFDDEVEFAVMIGVFFPIFFVIYICWLISRLIVKLIDKFV